MAINPGFTSFAKFVQVNGISEAAKMLAMPESTVSDRVFRPGTFTLSELMQLAKLTGTSIQHIVSQMAIELKVSADKLPRKVNRRDGATLVTELKVVEQVSCLTVAALVLKDSKVKNGKEYSSLAELIQHLGGCCEVAEALGITSSSLSARIRRPASFTLAKLQAVATWADTDLSAVVKLATQGM